MIWKHTSASSCCTAAASPGRDRPKSLSSGTFVLCTDSQLISGVEVLQALRDTSSHCLFTLTHPHAGIEILLVGLIFTIWITNLLHQIVLLVEHIITDTSQVGILQVSVEVDLDHTIANGVRVFLLA